MTEYFALSRSRDHQGNVVNRQLKPIVNCIHTQVGGRDDTMAVLIVEVYDD